MKAIAAAAGAIAALYVLFAEICLALALVGATISVGFRLRGWVQRRTQERSV